MTFLKSILKGTSQVMLQENTLTGALFLIGLYINSPIQATAALLSVTIATLLAKGLKLNSADIEKGLYGFSPCLVGIGMFVFFELNLSSILCTLLGIGLSTGLTYLSLRYKLPTFTFPFVLTVWFFLSFGSVLGLTSNSTGGLIAESFNFLDSTSKSIAQVFFQDNFWTGILFLLGLLVHSKRVALYVLATVIFTTIVARTFDQPLEWINVGLFGFNAVLAVIVFSDTKQNLKWALLSIILSILISWIFLNNNIIMLTAPFVFSSWICLGLKKLVPKTIN